MPPPMQPTSDKPATVKAANPFGAAIYRFGEFSIDLAKRKLFKGSHEVRITAKCVSVLIALVARAGKSVGKEELIAEVWGSADVSDATLTQHIFMLRKVLGGPKRDAYIVSVPGMGYRFVAQIQAEGAAAFLKGSLSAQYCANAKEFWEHRNEPAVRSALALYKEALRLDPENAQALAGIAECHYIIADYMYESPKEHLVRSQRAARQALLIDLRCGEAHMAMGKAALDLERRWDASFRSVNAALELIPQNPNALWASVWYPMLQRQFTQAERALRGLPKHHGSRHLEALPGMFELYAGRPSDARKRFKPIVEKYPDHWLSRLMYGQALFLCGERGDACQEFDRVWRAQFDPFMRRQMDVRLMAAGYLIYALFKTGYDDLAKQMWLGLERMSAERYVPAMAMALGHLATHDYREALRCIAQSRDEHSSWYTQLLVEPFVNEMRSMPEFQRLTPPMSPAPSATPPPRG